MDHLKVVYRQIVVDAIEGNKEMKLFFSIY